MAFGLGCKLWIYFSFTNLANSGDPEETGSIEEAMG